MDKRDSTTGSTAAKAVDSIQARLVEYSGQISWDALPPDVVDAARLRIIDALGANIGGYFGEPCRIIRDVAASMPSEVGATVLGTRLKTTPEMAAFANATATRHIEFTDFYHWPGAVDGHASDVVAAILATAEHVHATGREFVTAVVLGYEVFLRFCDVFPKAGFDYTNCAVVASAVASGRLMRLSAEEMAHCIAMAVVPNVILKQVRRDGKTGFKPAATGHAARAGVFAAILAKAGMEGPNLPFEGSHGFCDKVLGKRFTLPPMGGQGGAFRILNSQIKLRPSERNTVPLIMAAERLAPLPPVSQVRRVVVEVYRKAIEEAGTRDVIWNPQSHHDAYHSIPYAVAVTLLDGTLTLRSFDDSHLRNRDLRDLMQRIELRENEDFTRAFNAEPVEHRARITLHLDDGQTRSAEIDGGDDRRAQSDVGQISGKFRGLTEDLLGKARVDRILERLRRIEETADMAALPPEFVL